MPIVINNNIHYLNYGIKNNIDIFYVNIVIDYSSFVEPIITNYIVEYEWYNWLFYEEN